MGLFSLCTSGQDSGGDYNEEEFYQLFLKWQLISMATIIFLLAAEAFAYWRIRFREIKRPLAHIRIASLFLVLVLIPVIGDIIDHRQRKVWRVRT